MDQLFKLLCSKNCKRAKKKKRKTLKRSSAEQELIDGLVMSNRTRVGLVRCEHCGRQFNPHSAARHIPWCAKQQAASKRHKLSADKLQALERYKWRINYRPSNSMSAVQSQQQHPGAIRRQQFSLKEIAKQVKKSSVNSSATLSSPSAGSLNSVASNSTTDRQRPADARAQPPSEPRNHVITQQLKRSVSSHTLTKQRGVNSTSTNLPQHRAAIPSRATDASDNVNKMRTKSVNDLSSMSEIVETLAKRMEQIFAQNQVLLANLTGHQQSIGTRYPTSVDCRSDISDSSNDCLVQLVCHHCKMNCPRDSNYCQKCGCKLQQQQQQPPAAAAAASKSSNSPSPVN